MRNQEPIVDLTPAPFRIGGWTVFPETGRIGMGDNIVTLEPKVMGLLLLLAKADGALLSREQIEQDLWGGMILGEDTVARTVSRLRRALGDDAKKPLYVETLPKRGYRLLVPVVACGDRRPARSLLRMRPGMLVASAAALVAALCTALILYSQAPAQDSKISELTARADDLYMQFTRSDNEAAITLYERVLAMDGDYAPAQAGLANALVQRVIRWPNTPAGAGAASVQEALGRDMNQTDTARKILARATALAERAVRLAPRDPDALKALGLAYTMQGHIDRAEEIYRRAIAIDPNAWESMINLSEIYQIRQEPARSVAMLQAAFEAMDRQYGNEPQRVGPWQAAVGVLIGKWKEEAGLPQEAELWYRRTLEISPYEPEATRRLASLLRNAGDDAQANRLCATLVEKLGPANGCLPDGDR
ncbi:MAG: tetratricopeptide repeat protein [Alphaproteobacteria bacterium]|nr:MAG: tetratricopeptide repeat protein [Alphaproteobacteria bacterium]